MQLGILHYINMLKRAGIVGLCRVMYIGSNNSFGAMNLAQSSYQFSTYLPIGAYY
jgi:hypothetical protein